MQHPNFHIDFTFNQLFFRILRIYCAIRFRQSNAKNEPRPRSMSVLPSTDSDYSDTDDEEGQEMTELKKNDLGDSKQEINFDRADLQHSSQITVSL